MSNDSEETIRLVVRHVEGTSRLPRDELKKVLERASTVPPQEREAVLEKMSTHTAQQQERSTKVFSLVQMWKSGELDL